MIDLHLVFNTQCRGTAVSVLCAMLEGSKSYLAVADDK